MQTSDNNKGRQAAVAVAQAVGTSLPCATAVVAEGLQELTSASA